MDRVAVAAFAGYGCALAVGWAAAKLEKWWAPKWRATIWAFITARTTPTVAASAAAVAAAVTDAGVLAAAAAGAAAWLIAQGYVLLLVSARR